MSAGGWINLRHSTRIRCEKEAVNPRFLANVLHQKWREGYFFGICNRHVSQASVGRKKVEDILVNLPPLPEQDRIVSKVEELLHRVNASRERLAKVPEIMKRFRQSVLDAACSGRLTEDLRESSGKDETGEGLLALIRQERQAVRAEGKGSR